MLGRRCRNSSRVGTSAKEPVMEIHRIHPELVEREVRVLVVGCGGTGSAVLAGLPYLHQSLLAYGHPGGLHVTVLDGDTISPANCVRQAFARSEVGLNKAVVLVNRLNLFWGLKWEAVPAHLQPGSVISRSHYGDDLRAHIVVGCVDTRAARAAIRDAVSNWSVTSYWLDAGNLADSGQFILGEPLNQRNRRSRLRLRSAAEPYPAQAVAVMGVVKRWERSRSAAVVAECGTGKTLIALASIFVHSRGRHFTALVLTPPHLVEEWARGAIQTLPGVRVFLIDGLRSDRPHI